MSVEINGLEQIQDMLKQLQDGNALLTTSLNPWVRSLPFCLVWEIPMMPIFPEVRPGHGEVCGQRGQPEGEAGDHPSGGQRGDRRK